MSLKFSAIITSYNYADYVCQAVQSALDQTLPPEEVIVVDDGSTDGSQKLLAERYSADPRVRLVMTENGGQLAAFTRGADAARGDVLCFLDADDLWEPTYLERIGAVYSRYPLVNFVFTNLRYFGSRDDVLLDDAVSRDLECSMLRGAYDPYWNGNPTSALSLRRRLALQLLDLPDWMRHHWRICADMVLVYAADIMGARKYYLADPLVRYRAHGANAFLGTADRASGHMAAFRHALRIESIQAIYGRRIGLVPERKAEFLKLSKREFLNKPDPTQEDLRSYLRMIRRSSLRPLKKWEHAASIRKNYHRSMKANDRHTEPKTLLDRIFVFLYERPGPNPHADDPIPREPRSRPDSQRET